MWAKGLVKKIQQRAVAGLMLQGNRPAKQKAAAALGPTAAGMAALASQHELEELGTAGSFWCAACLTFSPRGKAGLEWLAAPCRPNWQLQAVWAGSRLRTQAVTSSHDVPVVMAGKFVAHESHSLGVYRGLFFCDHCGAYGSGRPRRLVKPCQPPQGEAKHWAFAVQRIKGHKLPSGLSKWPESEVVQPGPAAVLPAAVVAKHSGSYQPPATAAEKAARRKYLKAAAEQPGLLPYDQWLHRFRQRAASSCGQSSL